MFYRKFLVSIMNYVFKNIERIFVLCIMVFTLCCCVKDNKQKEEFIKKNIQKTNKKIEKKYGTIIIPDFLTKDELKLEGEDL